MKWYGAFLAVVLFAPTLSQALGDAAQCTCNCDDIKRYNDGAFSGSDKAVACAKACAQTEAKEKRCSSVSGPKGAQATQPKGAKPAEPNQPTPDALRRAEQLFKEEPALPSIPGPPQRAVGVSAPLAPSSPPSGPNSVSPGSPAAPTITSFAGTWIGNGSCGFTNLSIIQQGNLLVLQGLPGNAPLPATNNGNSAQAQGAIMFGKPNYTLQLTLLGNQLGLQATSSGGSCNDSLRRQ